MDIVHLSIEDVSVAQLAKAEKIEPTFEIHYNGAVFPCNPIPAVEHAHLVFQGYKETKALGFFELHTEDKNNIIPAIIDFLHGKELIISPFQAENMAAIASELGIPLIEKYANNCKNQNLMSRQYDRNYDVSFTPDVQ